LRLHATLHLWQMPSQSFNRDKMKSLSSLIMHQWLSECAPKVCLSPTINGSPSSLPSSNIQATSCKPMTFWGDPFPKCPKSPIFLPCHNRPRTAPSNSSQVFQGLWNPSTSLKKEWIFHSISCPFSLFPLLRTIVSLNYTSNTLNCQLAKTLKMGQT
jgi:hypothetical protein